MPRVHWLVPLSLALCLAPTGAGAAPGPGAAEKPAIERTVRASIEWALTRDTLALYSALAHDSTLFIFHPDSKSTIEGFAAFRAMCERTFLDPRFRATDSRLRDLRIRVSPRGDAAWYSCRLDDHAEWNGRRTGWDDARWTGVLEKRDGRWVIVQMHFSLASDAVTAQAQRDDLPAAGAGPYLGQPPPGPEPRLFAPGLVSGGGSERDIAVAPDGRTILFGVITARLATIMETRLEGDRWTEPVAASFAADTAYRHFEPCFSADGRRIYFLATRPTAGETRQPGWANQNIFYAERRDDGSWSEPRDLGLPVNTAGREFFPSLARDGTLYFTRGLPEANRAVIARSRLVDGRYQPPDTLPAPVNGRGTIYNAFVAPDQSYLVACVDDRPGLAPPGPRYMVFFRGPGDAWSEGVDLAARAPMGSGNAGSPCVSPDGRCFFFGSTTARPEPPAPRTPLTLRALRESEARAGNGGMDIWWMDAAFLEALRPAR
jgi:hypothetical protein